MSLGNPLYHELRGVYTIWLRDLTRFVNERVRLIGSIGQPLIYLTVMGTGFGATFRPTVAATGFDYQAFMFPGVLGMTVLFTSLFSAISVIWDREFGFLKEVLVAPVARATIVLGKALGGATVALLQASILLLLAPVAGIWLDLGQLLRLWAVMLMMAFALTSFGLAIASRMASMEGFQVVMNFLIIPMWLLSGAFFPLQGIPTWMQVLARLDPLTYGVDALRGVLYEGSAMADAFVLYTFGHNLTLIAALAVACFLLALLTFKGREG